MCPFLGLLDLACQPFDRRIILQITSTTHSTYSNSAVGHTQSPLLWSGDTYNKIICVTCFHTGLGWIFVSISLTFALESVCRSMFLLLLHSLVQNDDVQYYWTSSSTSISVLRYCTQSSFRKLFSVGQRLPRRLTGFYQRPKSLVSYSHMNCCLQNILYINLHILYISHIKTS